MRILRMEKIIETVYNKELTCLKLNLLQMKQTVSRSLWKMKLSYALILHSVLKIKTIN